MPKFKDFIIDTITNAGKILRAGFGSTFKIEEKLGKNNLVTEYDFKSEEYIIAQIQSHYPEHSIVSEERDDIVKESEYSWVIDPLDGTVNYANNIPIFSVSIALKKGGKLLAGAVYNPMLEELFYAEENEGAYFNGTKIYVSEKKEIGKSLLVTGFPYDIDNDPQNAIKSFTNVVRQGIPIRRLGSAALDLAYVACGRFDGFWEVNLKSWDVAAGILLVKEAGGICTNYKNEESQIDEMQILATNGHIHKQALELINDV